jgi:hypothetical protein
MRHPLARAVLLLTLAAASAARAEVFECGDGAPVDADSELLFDDAATRSDPRTAAGGDWHFSTLVRRFLPAGATDRQVSDLILDWFARFDREQQLAVDATRPAGADNPVRTLPRRPAPYQKIMVPWLAASAAARAAAGRPEDGTLDLSLAPFKLLAIVNRMDLRDPDACATSAGEGRFVFAALRQPTATPGAVAEDRTQNFLLIFEYDLPTTTRTARDWARAWHALASLPCDPADGCSARHARLADLTDEFSHTLAQIRINDTLTFPGELREMHVIGDGAGGVHIENVPVQQTPDLPLTGSDALGAFAFANQAEILAGRHVVPPALAGYTAPIPRRTQWTIPNTGGLADAELGELRFQLGKNTCNGCHSFEHPRVATVDGAYHISPEGERSGYLADEELPRRADEHCRLLAATTCAAPAKGHATRTARVH